MSRMQDDFENIYKQYHADIYKFLLKWTNGDVLLSEELTQETFYQIFLSLHRYRGECSVKTWMCRIAINVACKHYSKNPQCEEFTESPSSQEYQTCQTPEDMFLHKEELRQLRVAIGRLKQKYRDVIVCRICLEMPFDEIAEIMHISENSAKVLYHRAKKMLQKTMVSANNLSHE